MADQSEAPVTAPTPSMRFDGRDFVPDVAPVESPSPSGENADAGADAGASGDDPSSTGDGGNVQEVEAGSGEGDGGEAGDGAEPPRGTFWDQTPEEKRRERFDRIMERDNAREKELRELREFKAKAATPTTTEQPPEAPAEGVEAEPDDPDSYLTAAINAPDPAKLSEPAREIRKLNDEVIALYQERVPIAEKAIKEAETEIAGIKAQISRKQTTIEELEERSKAPGREGFYDAEIEELRGSIAGLDQKLTKAENREIRASMALNAAKEAYGQKLRVNRAKAEGIAEKTTSSVAQAKWMESERARLSTVWNEALDGVISGLKLPAKLHTAAKRTAFLEVQEIAAKRPADKPVTEADFKGLITSALKDLVEFSGTVSGQLEAGEADVRAAATATAAPKRRVASGAGDAKPKSKDEAFANLAAVTRTVGMRRAS